MTPHDLILIYQVLFGYLSVNATPRKKISLAYEIDGQILLISLDTVPRIVERETGTFIVFSTTNEAIPTIEIGPIAFSLDDSELIGLLNQYHTKNDGMILIEKTILALIEVDSVVKQYLTDFYRSESEKNDWVKKHRYEEAATERDVQRRKLGDFLSHLSIATEGKIVDTKEGLDWLDKVLKNEKEKFLVHFLKQKIDG